MAQAEGVISLSQRLRKLSGEARRLGAHARASDLRLAGFYLKRLAALLIAEEARNETNPSHRRALQNEAAQLWCNHE